MTRIEPYHPRYLDSVVQLSLRAWAPVFDSMRSELDSEVYQAFYPDTWQASQQKAVEDTCTAGDTHVWVAVEGETPVGFVAVRPSLDSRIGEIHMIAVDPPFQDQGIGSALTGFALVWMREAGLSVAMVETGADPCHAAARHTYETAGFKAWSVARYFKAL